MLIRVNRFIIFHSLKFISFDKFRFAFSKWVVCHMPTFAALIKGLPTASPVILEAFNFPH